MLLRLTSVAGAGLFCASVALAQHQPVENGLPCVAELCVDDELTSVLSLPWIDVDPPRRASAASTVSETFRGDEEVLQVVASYWPGHVFDADGLKALAQVKAVCREIGVRQRPSAEFLGADGLRTRVVFEPEPTAAGDGVAFRVAKIVRQAPRQESGEAVRALGRSEEQRYAGLSRYASSTAPGVQWRSRGPDGPALVLLSAVGDPQGRAVDLGRHPMCQSD